MKVKFDLKYRQQIESGEYKVETVNGRQVRIVCWDAHNPYRENDIVALATSSSGEGENILRYYSNGHLISDSANVGNKDLIVVIPDDDEKIEKIITDSVFYQYGAGVEYKDVLDYLDKLKKQKDASKAIEAVEQPTNEEMLRTLRTEYEKGVADTIAKYGQIPVFRVGDTIIAKDGTCIPKVPFHIERIEDGCYWDGDGSILVCNQDDFQLEEDEKIRHSIIKDIEFTRNYTEATTGRVIGKYNGQIAWLKFLPERFNLQPKQEWSDDIIQKAVKEVGLTQHQIDWFKTNVFPPKQEWSEEDEKHLNWVIEHFSQSGELYHDLIAWFKSLPERLNLQPKQEWSEDKYPKNIENAATMFCFDNGLNITPHQAVMIAKHFYELGFKRMSDGRA